MAARKTLRWETDGSQEEARPARKTLRWETDTVHSQHWFGQHHRPPEPLAAFLVIGTGQGRFGSLSAGTAEPALQTGSGFFERPKGARGAGRADLPGGRSAPATPD